MGYRELSTKYDEVRGEIVWEIFPTYPWPPVLLKWGCLARPAFAGSGRQPIDKTSANIHYSILAMLT